MLKEMKTGKTIEPSDVSLELADATKKVVT